MSAMQTKFSKRLRKPIQAFLNLYYTSNIDCAITTDKAFYSLCSEDSAKYQSNCLSLLTVIVCQIYINLKYFSTDWLRNDLQKYLHWSPYSS